MNLKDKFRKLRLHPCSRVTKNHNLLRRGLLVLLSIMALISETHSLQASESTPLYLSTTLHWVTAPESRHATTTGRVRAGQASQEVERKLEERVPARILATLRKRGITVSLEKSCPSDGYFFEPDANESSRLRICVSETLFTSEDLLPILLHETFHGIHYLLHPNEEIWIREGLAQWFEFRTTRLNSGNVNEALRNPFTPLFGKYETGKLNRAQYGHNLLYFYYLWNQCGGDELIWKTTEGAPNVFGVTGIDQALVALKKTQRPQCANFESSAIHFEVARIHNRITGDATDSKRYFLTATTITRPTPEKSISLAALAETPALQPILLSGDFDPTFSLPTTTRRFWLEQRHPFRVTESRPESGLENWIQLWIKPN